MIECKFCNNKFKSKQVLKIHQKTAKYCLKIQGVNFFFECKDCKKKLTTKYRLSSHKESCIPYQIRIKTEEKDIIISSLKEKIKKNNLELKEQKKLVKDLQNQLTQVAIKAVSRPTHTTSNKTIQINNYIKQMEPLRIDRIKENVPMLTLDHHVKGPEGYAEYALEFPFKDRIICVDVARNKIKYKNEEGDIVEDPGFRKMMLKLCDALKDRSYKLCQDHYEKLLDKFSEEEMDNTDFDFMEAAKAIHKYANGRESEFCSKIIRLISKGSKV